MEVNFKWLNLRVSKLKYVVDDVSDLAVGSQTSDDCFDDCTVSLFVWMMKCLFVCSVCHMVGICRFTKIIWTEYHRARQSSQMLAFCDLKLVPMPSNALMSLRPKPQEYLVHCPKMQVHFIGIT